MSGSRMIFRIAAVMFTAVLWCADVYGQKQVVDKVVAVIGNSSVLYSEVEMMSKVILNERREAGYTSDRDPVCEALENIMMQRLLYNQAQIDSLDAPAGQISVMVENVLQQEIELRGSQTALEAYYHKPIFNIREELKAQYTESELAKLMQGEIKSKVTVNTHDVDRFYRKMSKEELPVIPEQYVYAHIVKYPLSTQEAKFRTRERMLELRQRIINGENFAALARLYSQDPGSSLRGGEMDFMEKDMFVRPFGEALARLKINQISEVVETEFGFHIIQLLETKGNMYRSRHILLKPEFTSEEIEKTVHAMDTILVKINAGDITFEEAAAQYSDDKYSKQNKGIVTNHEYLESVGTPYASLTSTRFFKEELNPNDYNVLKDMKVGDLSASFASEDAKSNVIVKAVMLKEIIPSHTAELKDDYAVIENLALNEKGEEMLKKWVEEKVQGMYIRVDDQFKGCEFEYPALLK